ncbi:MAG: sulfurtransferase complex subunit TusB [Pseudomonadales bacterium]|nr:sulfurtransferase complex subunit TusB [Pseudomonadales bacterium]
MILHTVNRSPFGSDCLQSCLDIATIDSGVILIEDGVYCALANTELTELISTALTRHKIYVLSPDLQARGIADAVAEGIEAVDYAGFVELCTQFDKVVSWY